MPKVYIARCDDYEYSSVCRAVCEGIEAIGGVEALIGRGKNVAVKPNLLKTNKPRECVTTHPSVVRAVLETVIKPGNRATIVETSSRAYNRKNLDIVYQATGMADVAAQTGAALNDNFEAEMVRFDHGRSVREMRIAQAVHQSDAVVSVAKLKTHAMMTYTGAVKNLFGIVPGHSKAECHFRLPDIRDFAGMLADIAVYARPPISVIDAVWGMEGQGPSRGNPRKLGAIIVSDCPFAADYAGSKMVGIDPEDNPVLISAIGRGLLVPGDVEILGAPLAEMTQNDFIKPPVHFTNLLEGKLPKWLAKLVGDRLTLYPTFNPKRCVSCGDCIRSCPNDALVMKDGLPVLDEAKCINCFCCQEMCPKRAVDIRRPLLLRIVTRFFS